MSKSHPHDNRDWKNLASDTDLKALIDQELQFEPFAFEKQEIADVPVYTRHLPFAPCIHIRIGFRYGAIHDEMGKEGTAHFLEHMIFDGSSMFADEKETQEFGKTIMLDSLNAHTGLFELFVLGKCLPHHFETALAGVFSMILEPKLTEKSFEHEKKVITQEAWGVFLNEKRIAYVKKERANIFADLPDRLRIASALGWPETVLALTHDDIKDAHKKYFVKENMEVFIAGNLESLTLTGGTGLHDALSAFLKKMPSGEAAKHPLIPDTISPPKISVFDHTYEEIGLSPRQQANISISSHIPRIGKIAGAINSEEENKFFAAQSLAGDLVADLIYRKLRLENSWCYGAGASAYPSSDVLEFSIGTSIDFNHIDDAIDILWNIVEDIKKGEYRSDFEKTKRLAIDNRISRERNTDDILYDVINDVRIDGEVCLLKNNLHQIAEVEFEDVQNVIAEYFKKERVFTEIVRPA